ncbi:MAG: LysR family transcriptional regulator [Planctomycetota bacterium]
MDIKQLRYFLAIVDDGSLKGAARTLGLRQPSLSQQLARLEDDLGQTLFDRLGQGIVLTTAGELLVPRARRLVADATDLRRAVQEDIDEGRGTLSIGALPTIAPFVIPSVLRQFRDEIPEANVVFSEFTTLNLTEAVANAEVEVGLVATPIEDDRVTSELLWREPLLLAMSPDSPCAQKDRLCEPDLAEVGIVVLHEVHCLGDQTRTFCRVAGVERAIRIEAGQLSTALEMVRSNLGVTIIPMMARERAAQHGLIVRPLVHGEPSRPIGVIRNGCRPLSALARRFVELARTRIEAYRAEAGITDDVALV